MTPLVALTLDGVAVVIDRVKLQAVLDAALAEDGLPPSELAVRFVDDAESAELHREHFDAPDPTDVMTFPDGTVNPETGVTRLGDLAVGAQVAEREAGARGRTVSDELILYVLHGLLHLLGHDDEDERDLAEMWARQRALLATVGIELEASPDL